MRILFLSRWYPYPSDNGSKLRVASLLRGLCERHDVTLISFHDPTEATPPPPAGPAPVEVHCCPYRDFEPGSRRAIAGYLQARPRFLVDTHSQEMEDLIRTAVGQTRFDVVIASQLSMAAYWKCFDGVPAIFEEVELGAFWPYGDETGSGWTRARARLSWAKHKRYLSGLLRHFACCTVASEVERRLLATVADRTPVHVVPNSIETMDTGDVAVERAPSSLIFTGSLRFQPNHDAMSWFVQDVLPRIRARVPEARLTVTGETGGRTLPSTAGVFLPGYVADVRRLVASATVSVAPIRTGGGTRLKILEAMALGTPVVATAKAVEGIDVEHGQHVLVADSGEAFADAVVELLRNPSTAGALATRAGQLCHARYSSSVVVPRFVQLVDQAVAA